MAELAFDDVDGDEEDQIEVVDDQAEVEDDQAPLQLPVARETSVVLLKGLLKDLIVAFQFFILLVKVTGSMK